MLVVLDNARDAEQVRPLLPGTPTALAIVTSRDQLSSLVATEGAQLVMVDVLSYDEATELLAARLGAERLAADRAAHRPGVVGALNARHAQRRLVDALGP